MNTQPETTNNQNEQQFTNPNTMISESLSSQITYSQVASSQITLNIEDIMQILPHKYPMLLVDRITIDITKQHAIGTKCVSMNEWFFQGHFPSQPVMPGVLIIEAMAQTSVALCYKMMQKDGIDEISKNSDNNLQDKNLRDNNPALKTKKSVYLSTVENAKFRKLVVPGDLLYLNVTKVSDKRGFWKFQGEGVVNGKTACSAEWGAFVG